VPMSSALQSSRLDPRVNLTDKIYYAVSQAANNYYTLFGWQINFFASQNMLILNIPNGNGFDQYVPKQTVFCTKKQHDILVFTC